MSPWVGTQNFGVGLFYLEDISISDGLPGTSAVEASLHHLYIGLGPIGWPCRAQVTYQWSSIGPLVFHLVPKP